MTAPDRLELLIADGQTKVTGLDYVFVHEDQVTLDVHFLRSPATLDEPLDNPDPAKDLAVERIRITAAGGSDGAERVPVSALEWIAGDEVLRLTTPLPGGFSPYILEIDDERIDPYFSAVRFSFKANCPSDLDCRPPPHLCPPEEEVDFPVDYQARDFWSLRRALLDFASQRYPDWQDRLEADVGVMLAEMMSALGDELAYYQDRIGREAHLETATQRRSLRRHARLVDYEVHDGLAAATWLDVTVETGLAGMLPAGADVSAVADGSGRNDYEVGRGLAEVADAKTYAVDAARNRLRPHLWDEDDTCLPAGATELVVKGHHESHLPLDDFEEGRDPGRWVLLRTDPGPGLPARRWLVRLTRVEELEDPLISDSEFGSALTRLGWEESEAVPFELDLTALSVRGNLVPATAGRTESRFLVVGREPDDEALGLPAAARRALSRTVERRGADGSTTHLLSLPGSEEIPLGWLGEDPRQASPEVRLAEVEWSGAARDWVEVAERPWSWRRSLIGSQPNDRHFTLDDGTWGRVVAFRRQGREIVHRDYAGGEGSTLRFGDGELGLVPAAGTLFRVTYRLGNGRRGNVAADSLTHPGDGMPGFVAALTNPLPAAGGRDPETAREVRQLAPEAFRAVAFRAVRPEDHAEATERLDWVDRAGATCRWTGSWLTTFVAADPRGAVTLTAEQRRQLDRQLDRFRQAGREAQTAEPHYADLDLEIAICVERQSYRGEVKESVLAALLGRAGFFAPDHFTFGTPLWRSRLEAAVQGVPGVRAVEEIRIRRRGHFDWRPLIGPYLPAGDHEVIRLENDPDHPERGSLRLVLEGGA